MRLYRPGFLARCLYPDAIFRVKTADRSLFLTFDDGPDPASTPLLLHILQKHSIKAIFFCNGCEAEKQPGLINKILESGHIVGNHTHNHLNGWHTDAKSYVNNIIKASAFTSDNLFRPPYGHLKFKQYRYLRKKFQILFWDVMPYDFDKEFGSERALNILKDKIRPGSVIVLHDTPSSTAISFLDEFLTYATNMGYEFRTSISR